MSQHTAENDAGPDHLPCDMGCQPDWHRDDCAVYIKVRPTRVIPPGETEVSE